MIQVERLTKYYGQHAAVRDLSFSIRKGEVIGFLGLNGAGKSTTLRMLGCVLLPTAGRVLIDGIDAVHNPNEVRKRIGFLPDTPPLYDEMTVGEYLSFVARLHGMPSAHVRSAVEAAEQKTALRGADDEVIGTLSHGFRQRVGLAQALVHRPELLVLDEPTSGLDPVQIVEMRNLIRELRGEHTVLVSSHILSEISQTCDRLLVIQDGQLVAQGTEDELANQSGTFRAIELEVRGAEQSARGVEVLSAVASVKAVTVLLAAEGRTVFRVETETDVRAALAKALVLADFELLRMERSAGKLESIFLQLTRDGASA